MKEKKNSNIGAELLSLLREQRYLYHELKGLTKRQQQLIGTGSPELMLEVITGKRKLIEKLHQVEEKLSPIKAGWEKVSGQLEPVHNKQISTLVNQVQQIIEEIKEVASPEMIQHLPIRGHQEFKESLAGINNQ